jgi:PKD repeat protein
MLATLSYSTLGEKPFAVRVTDGQGATHVATGSVTVVNAQPVVDFSLQPTAPAAGETVDLFAMASDPDGTVAKIEWDFNDDGNTDATGAVAQTRFNSVGSKVVRVRVTDSDGDVAEAARSVRIGNRAPAASFELRPAAPIAGQGVTFFSTSSDPDNNLESAAWDLDGDGIFDTQGRSAGRTFDTPGTYTVALRVTDSEGLESIAMQTVEVAAPVPQTNAVLRDPPTQRLLSPFPVVRMAGRIGATGTRFRVLSVNAPQGSNVTVRCIGRSCPFRSSARTSAAGTLVRLKRLERVLLRTGVRIEIFVTKPGMVGKYTSVAIRSNKPPKRSDRCVLPGSMNPAACPA